MTPLRALACLSLALLVGCSGSGTGTDGPSSRDSLADLWSALPNSYGADCGDTYRTIRDFGSRYLACNAAAGFPPTVLVDRAPVAPFRSGPHTATAQSVRLDLDAGRQFGHYDPAFVRWVTGAAVVDNPVARQLIRPIYREHVARPARLWWLGLMALESVGYPETLPGQLGDYADYLAGGPITQDIEGFDGGESVSTYDFIDSLPPLVADGEIVVTVDGVDYDLIDWPLREEASTGVAFWIRRAADGTADEWRAGLRAMLAAYDGAWLASHGG